MSSRRWVHRIIDYSCFRIIPAIPFGLMILPALAMQVSFVAGSHAATIDITDYGANGDDDLDDTAAIHAAITALSANDVLLIPQSSLYFKVAIDANFTIDQSGVRVIVRGRVLATGTPSDGNYMFNVPYTNNCEFIGEGGTLEGSDEYVIVGDARYGPSLIRFVGSHDCSVRDLALCNGPTVSVNIVGCNGCRITNCNFEGGPRDYGWQIFGIFYIGATDLLIEQNRFIPADGGGKMHQWICSSSTSSNTHVSIVDNQFDSAHDHAIYCSGLFNSIIANNTVRNTGGSAIKTIGENNVIANNNIYNSLPAGGIEIRNSSRCIVANNLIDGFAYVGIIASPYNNYSGDMVDNIIRGNVLRAADSGEIYEGIRVWPTGRCSRTKIEDNIIVGAGGSGSTPALSVVGGQASYAVSISGNTLDECGGNGIYINNVNRSIVSDNIVQVPGGSIPITQENVTAENLLTDNLPPIFCLPSPATNPHPADKQTGVSITTDLSWTEAEYASSYDVYFGMEETLVANAGHESPVFQGNQPQTTFNPGIMEHLTPYYWRIDPVNDIGTTTGAVWSFTTGTYPGDFDKDLDVDQEDFGQFQACFSGSGLGYEAGCQHADFNDDGDVDQDDFAMFQVCLGGANQSPGC